MGGASCWRAGWPSASCCAFQRKDAADGADRSPSDCTDSGTSNEDQYSVSGRGVFGTRRWSSAVVPDMLVYGVPIPGTGIHYWSEPSVVPSPQGCFTIAISSSLARAGDPGHI